MMFSSIAVIGAMLCRSVHLHGLGDVLHPLALLGLGRGRHHERPLAVVDVEAELGPHPRLAVHHLTIVIVRVIVIVMVQR